MRTTRIKTAIWGKDYRFLFLVFFLGFYVLNVLLNKSHVFYSNIGSVVVWFATTFIIINFLLAVMAAVTVNLVIMRFRETRTFNGKEGGTATLGLLGGIIGGGCPACFVGVLPALIGFFGIGVSFNNYPYLALGIQVFSILILALAMYLLSGEVVCKIKPMKQTKQQ